MNEATRLQVTVRPGKSAPVAQYLERMLSSLRLASHETHVVSPSEVAISWECAPNDDAECTGAIVEMLVTAHADVVSVA